MTAVTTAHGITLEYEDSGSRQAPPILLIMGLGGQLTFWPDEFCTGLSERGYRIIRYDNRDIGLSSKITPQRRYSLGKAMLASLLHLQVSAPYTLNDMADDAVGLLDALDLPSVHVVGVSMGGMIGQILANRYPLRVRSLTSIMSTTGNPKLPRPKLKILKRLLTKPPGSSREARIQYIVDTLKLIGSPAYPNEEQRLWDMVARNYDRDYDPGGTARQFLAILASGHRVDMLKAVKAPTLVIHGDADPLLHPNGGRDTVANIPDAKLEIIEGMGHDLPITLVPRLVDLIASHIDKNQRAAA